MTIAQGENTLGIPPIEMLLRRAAMNAAVGVILFGLGILGFMALYSAIPFLRDTRVVRLMTTLCLGMIVFSGINAWRAVHLFGTAMFAKIDQKR